jgi:uncharacterized membrane protein
MNIKNHFKNTLLAGVLTLVPLGVTYFVLSFLFKTIDGWLAPIVKNVLGKPYPGIGLLATLLIVYLVGVIVSNIVGRKLVGAGDWILNKIPLVREIYAPVKRLAEMVLIPSHSRNFKRVVAIKTPGSPMRVIGFVTGEVNEEASDVTLLSVFVPTSPNPTTGVLLFCDPEIVYETNLKPDAAMKLLVSGGIVAPHDFMIRQVLQHTIDGSGRT